MDPDSPQTCGSPTLHMDRCSVLTFTDKHLVSLGDCLGQEETHNPLLTDVEESLRLLRGPDTNLRESQIPECFLLININKVHFNTVYGKCTFSTQGQILLQDEPY
jgi:hypothetical protein